MPVAEIIPLILTAVLASIPGGAACHVPRARGARSEHERRASVCSTRLSAVDDK